VKQRSLIIAGLSLIAASISAAPVQAEDALTFFPNNMAATVFEREVSMLMPRMKDDPVEEAPSLKPAKSDPESTTLDAAEPASQDGSDSLKNRLARKYGDPTEEPKIRIQDDAPPSMKGMLEALDAGDESLAYDYAQQYVKSMQRYQKIYGEVVSLTGAVMKSNNQAEGTQWQNVPTLFEHQELADKKREQKIQELLKMAAQAQATPTTQTPDQGTASRDRATIRAALRQRSDIQPSLGGQVNLIAFVDPAEANNCSTLQEMRTLAKARANDNRIALLAASTRQISDGILEVVGKRIGISFPFKDGSTLAGKLGATTHCTLAVITPDQKRAILLSTPTTAEFMDELISTLQGASRV
jgi:hypothetical protein